MATFNYLAGKVFTSCKYKKKHMQYFRSFEARREREKHSFKNNPFVKFSTCHNYPQNATHSLCFMTTYRKFHEAILDTL